MERKRIVCVKGGRKYNICLELVQNSNTCSILWSSAHIAHVIIHPKPVNLEISTQRTSATFAMRISLISANVHFLSVLLFIYYSHDGSIFAASKVTLLDPEEYVQINAFPQCFIVPCWIISRSAVITNLLTSWFTDLIIFTRNSHSIPATDLKH